MPADGLIGSTVVSASDLLAQDGHCSDGGQEQHRFDHAGRLTLQLSCTAQAMALIYMSHVMSRRISMRCWPGGQCFSIEPRVYLNGKFSVRLEKIVILRDVGPEILRGDAAPQPKKWPKRRKCARFGLEGDEERRERGGAWLGGAA